jgi:hypothetical protein
LLSKEFLSDLQKFIDNNLEILNLQVCKSILSEESYSYEPIRLDEMETFIINKKKPSFTKILFKHIDKIGVSDSEIYKKAGIDRRHFSKIRSNIDYHPSKNTAIALSLALMLDQKEADNLIGSAGYTLSDSEIFDLVITTAPTRISITKASAISFNKSMMPPYLNAFFAICTNLTD